MTSAEIIYESIAALKEFAKKSGSASLLASAERAEAALMTDLQNTHSKQGECDYEAVMAAVFPDLKETAA